MFTPIFYGVCAKLLIVVIINRFKQKDNENFDNRDN